ncbi:MAG: PLP-dependent aminotransferase family protein [Hyphomicrobiales bacterium]
MKRQFPIENMVLHRGNGHTLHRQLYMLLRGLIEKRSLPSGSSLPSTRRLAEVLQIGRNTVIAAYEQLALEGFVSIAGGRRPVIAGLPVHHKVKQDVQVSAEQLLSRRGRDMARLPFHHGAPGVLAFHPGLPDAQFFPFNAWSKLLTRRAKRSDLFGTYHVTGYPPLREALASYLAASRGVNCEPEQIIITSGAQSAFDVLARVLTDPGDAVWMEEPGYYGAAAAFVSAGATLMPFRVSKSGWDITPPPKKPRLIFVTPSCHYPLGHTMNMEQRLQLVQVADRLGAWIIEDDYDSEYRFQGQPIPPCKVWRPGTRWCLSAHLRRSSFRPCAQATWWFPEPARCRQRGTERDRAIRTPDDTGSPRRFHQRGLPLAALAAYAQALRGPPPPLHRRVHTACGSVDGSGTNRIRYPNGRIFPGPAQGQESR